MQTPSILVLIPAYNEEGHILDVVASLQKEHYNVLVINDGSTDNTKVLLETNNINAVHHLINRGAGAAIQTGFDVAKQGNWDIIVTIDGDGQCDIADIPALILPLQEGKADIVTGNRFRSGSSIPVLRRLYNFVASVITWLLSGIYLTDTQSGMRAYSRKAIEKIHIEANGFEFCSDIIRQAAYLHLRIKAVPIRVFYTKASMRKGQNFASGLNTVAKLLLRSLMR